MYPVRLHPRLELPADLVFILFDAAAASVRAEVRRRRRRKPGARPQQTLRPGPHTPIWNELARHAQPYLRKRGEKVKLARILGVPRQRLNDYLHARSACPDAERALLLLCWLACRRQGRELTA